MHANGSGWRVEEDASRPVLMALYLRDALGIVDPGGLPRLLGTGIRIPSIAPEPAVGWAWTRLWVAIIEPDAPSVDLPLDGPPEFDAAVRRHLDDARTFAQVAHDEFAVRAIERVTEDPDVGLLWTHLVAERETASGAAARAFRLRVEVLPLTTAGVWWIGDGAIAVDDLLYDDGPALRQALAPIVERMSAPSDS